MPVLASSGIDYNIKIWIPTSDNLAFDETQAHDVSIKNSEMIHYF